MRGRDVTGHAVEDEADLLRLTGHIVGRAESIAGIVCAAIWAVIGRSPLANQWMKQPARRKRGAACLYIYVSIYIVCTVSLTAGTAA